MPEVFSGFGQDKKKKEKQMNMEQKRQVTIDSYKKRISGRAHDADEPLMGSNPVNVIKMLQQLKSGSNQGGIPLNLLKSTGANPGYTELISESMRMQVEAQQRQRMTEQQIQALEEGYDAPYGAGSRDYESEYDDYKPETNDSNYQSGSSGSKKKKKSRLGQGIKFGVDGEATWE